MSLLDVILPKKYRNSKVLYEQNLDAWRHATEEAFANVNANFTQLAKDLFPTGYDYDNTGQAFYYTSLLEIINLVITGGTPITGTSSDTFTINTDGNSAVLTTANETASHTYSFPDGSGEFVLKDLTQTLTLKTLVTPTIASFVNATHDHTNAAGGGDLTTYIHKTNTGNDVADPTQNGDVVTKGWGASAYDAIGAAGAVQSNLNTHTGLTGTNVHGLGTASLNNTGDFDAAGVAAGLVTQTLHGVVLGTGAGTLAATAEGTNGTVLRGVTGSNPSFGAVNLATDVTGVLPAANGGGGALSSGSIPFSNGTNLIENLTAYQQLFFDNTNHRLGVGTVAPGYGIHLYGSALGSDSPSIVVENLNASGHANLRMITAAGADWTLRAREAQNLYLVDSSSTPINRIAATSDELHLVFGPTSAANPYIHKSEIGRAHV